MPAFLSTINDTIKELDPKEYQRMQKSGELEEVMEDYQEQITVLRVVLANPLTTDEILESVLAEQCTIVLQQDIQALLKQVESLCEGIDTSSAAACVQGS